ncbi:MAG: hypothetical protein WD872_20655 [Pirellulaceae bacterium]
MSVVVLDPSKSGEAARIARWNFDASATRQKLDGGSAAKGIRLQMPWPATPPQSDRLHLFVRYVTADGRQLQTDREIFLSPAGEASHRWTPRQSPTPISEAANSSPAESAGPTALAEPAKLLAAPAAWSPYR